MPAWAHTSAKPIELWGPFLPDTVTCLRLMSRATHACFATVLAIEVRCRDAILRRETLAGKARKTLRGEAPERSTPEGDRVFPYWSRATVAR